jgi:hypothetical protein
MSSVARGMGVAPPLPLMLRYSSSDAAPDGAPAKEGKVMPYEPGPQ